MPDDVEESPFILHTPVVSYLYCCVQVIGQDDQQPRKERQPRVSQRGAALLADQDGLSVDTTSDIDQDTEVEEVALELDSIVLTELPDADVTDTTWND